MTNCISTNCNLKMKIINLAFYFLLFSSFLVSEFSFSPTFQLACTLSPLNHHQNPSEMFLFLYKSFKYSSSFGFHHNYWLHPYLVHFLFFQLSVKSLLSFLCYDIFSSKFFLSFLFCHLFQPTCFPYLLGSPELTCQQNRS